MNALELEKLAKLEYAERVKRYIANSQIGLVRRERQPAIWLGALKNGLVALVGLVLHLKS